MNFIKRLLERYHNIADIFSGRRAGRLRGDVMYTAVGWRPDDETYKERTPPKFGNAPEWTKPK